jgi:heme a synthase
MATSWPDSRLSQRLAQLCAHLVVALVALVGIGGATRVMEAGLACPDWPLCYGSLLPGGRMNMQVFLEWFHRLDAFVVGVALLVLCGVSLWQRRSLPRWLPWASGAALLLVAIQGGLGALTVLALLPSAVVTAHLAVALLLVGLLSASSQALLRHDPQQQSPLNQSGRGTSLLWAVLAATALVAVLAQCLLGGAMASRWAAGSCLQSGVSCSWIGAHRQLASAVALTVGLQALAAISLLRQQRLVLGLSLGALALVLVQIGLGVSSWRLQLQAPLVTVAHQVVAALLVAMLTAALARRIDASSASSWRLEVAHG